MAQLVYDAVRPDGTPLFPNAPDPVFVALCEAYPADGPVWVDARPGSDLAQVLSETVSERLADTYVVELARAHARMIAHHEPPTA